VTLDVHDMPKGLSIRVTEPKKTGRILLMIVTGIVAGYVVYRMPFAPPIPRWLVEGLLAIGLLTSVIAALRGCDVQLRVTNLDLVSSGHAPEGYRASTIPRADVFRFEFRNAIGGGDDAEQPQGLYVEHHGIGTWAASTCILPQIDRAQTEQIIEAIYHRFPDTGTLSPNTAQPSALITLGLEVVPSVEVSRNSSAPGV
jgi:hypothetical protein